MMPVNYVIRADVVDIRIDTARRQDIFLVDTNVWYWMTYSRASMGGRSPNASQLTDYPDYLAQALSAKARLRNCGLTLSELAHLIEGTERDIYCASHGGIGKKVFRHNFPRERNNVVAELEAVWGQIESMSNTISLTIDSGTASSTMRRFHSHPLDGYDLFFVEAMQAAGVVQIISDDGDFATIPNVVLFTANERVIQAATANGKLMTR